MVFDDWCYKKEIGNPRITLIEQEIKYKLLLKMRKELSQEISTKRDLHNKETRGRAKKMEKWLTRKKRELSQKKKMQKSTNALKRIQDRDRKEMNKKAFNKWLRKSMGDLKLERRKTKEIQREKQNDNLERQQEQKKIQSEIAFKQWVKGKRIQKSKEKKVNRDLSQ
ncbi:unnamed protein product [Moneuplotes crassus]|uniref:Uncharacterized protein n=1 Tax=Euplotes crassus TaxID=5936 RepID=A0AAD1U951_EUPCR|nr:unnamed protein product [Moneuplotes crassus]